MTRPTVAKFEALPPELYLLIAHQTVAESGHNIKDLVRVTNINAQTRNTLTNTSDLWRKFTLSASSSSHKLGSLCVCRSGNQTLDLFISLPHSIDQDKGVGSLFECFRSAAPRVAQLSVYIRHPFSLNVVNALLQNEKHPALRSIEVGYDNKEHQGFITLPSNGACFHSIALTGVQTQPWCQFDLRNLDSLQLGSGDYGGWMHISIAPLLRAAISLQDLHFVGDQGMFRTFMDRELDGPPFILPALRRVRFVNTAPGFIFTFLRAVNTPLLEEVDMTAPPHHTHNEAGREIFRWNTAINSVRRDPAVALPPHTLKLRDRNVEYNQKDMLKFVLFLTAIFPNITSLEIEGQLLPVLHMLERLVLGHQRAPGLNLPQAWKIETLKVNRRFDQEMEVEYEDLVKSLTGTLGSLKTSGAMNLKELRLSVDRSIQPPVGSVSVDALKELVGELILDD
ncbi:hypothetical protein M407DRAFT_28470 [Tulasnella calospora MUT 4182]|uniref:F-box domain-containing protein n=1 Tax=Tulasnella calospora MUT 4182 TaxID=1051891 RepID=A0A0C3QC02_9AGAM|nr:hypothetical protein M407DRAFT_28470 [Tulasnella calospora MUT 4182]